MNEIKMTSFFRIAQIIEFFYVDNFDETHIEHHNIKTKFFELIMNNQSQNLNLFILCNNRFV